MADWQSIDTAATDGRADGRDVLLVLARGRQLVGHWSDVLPPGWVIVDETRVTPTHYQDLPEPPPPAPPVTADPPPPVLTTLDPETAALGAPSFTLRVLGTGFVEGSTILWNGAPEPTSYVSATEVTTAVNMATAQVAMPIPVQVQNPDGALSNELTFTLTDV
jgi:hypothetical protein